MEYTEIGKTGLKVSKICLGTMTWGQQNSETEAHEQLDYALTQGINFIDTAELYAVPSRPATYGLTEKYIGNWIAARKNRDKYILASKISGPGPKHIREGSKFTPEQLKAALEGSLNRLQTDYIDLYQLHWPERKTNYFGRLGYKHNSDDTWEDNFLQVLETLNGFIKEGKIRHFGLSNESAWGTMRFLHLAELHKLPKPVSIQNPYNLLNRSYEVGLSEISMREDIKLLAYSPMAFGLLSGKYFKTNRKLNARIHLFPQLQRYNTDETLSSAKKYVELAEQNGLSPAQMALAFVTQQDFVASNIVGATNMEQLKENISSIGLKLDASTIEGIENIHNSQPNPAP